MTSNKFVRPTRPTYLRSSAKTIILVKSSSLPGSSSRDELNRSEKIFAKNCNPCRGITLKYTWHSNDTIMVGCCGSSVKEPVNQKYSCRKMLMCTPIVPCVDTQKLSSLDAPRRGHRRLGPSCGIISWWVHSQRKSTQRSSAGPKNRKGVPFRTCVIADPEIMSGGLKGSTSAASSPATTLTPRFRRRWARGWGSDRKPEREKRALQRRDR